ncbi:MAG: ChaN family lipoprotein [Nisaea sp.]|uniref:ChaN family lipoprotein n=1 Tax=Nisaea sp. TaxID=2024842 RepID=UPI001B1F299D|nr:ChaN family lipoprotein [Nisaea sp.]MBO6562101.1 ChaN family lipoprotein [Nisaea sp.]
MDPEAYLARELASHRLVLLGEKHDNPEHHRIQARLLAQMVDLGRRPALVWEMVPRGKQPAIDDLAAGGNADPDRFADAVGWAESGWPDWKYYRPIAEVALAAGLPMVAGNIDRGTVRQLASDPESADKDLMDALRLNDPLPEAVRDAVEEEVYRGHCELVPRDRLEPMIRVQVARDASLAEAMVRAAAMADGAVLIAGGQHARRDIGAGYHLIRRFGALEVASLALLERDADNPAIPDAALSRKFDFVWFTEQAQPDRDYCAELAARFGKHK